MTEKSRVTPFGAGQGTGDYILVVHDIRSVYNVGALFRTADAVGISRIILSGFSPTPIDRFGRARTDLAKSALGAEQAVVWEYVDSILDKLVELKESGYEVVGLEQDARSVDYKQVARKDKMVFVVGTETVGMDAALINACDVVCEIPMRGMKESLNVSVATGILLYRILDTGLPNKNSAILDA